MILEIENPPPPPLSWRTWLLVPLVLVGIFGLAVPGIRLNALLAVEPAPAASVERFPYDGGLLAVLERGGLPKEAIDAVRARHERLLRENAELGGVTTRELQVVQETIRRYPPK